MYSNSTEWATTMTNKICITIAPPFDERRPVALHKRVAEIHRLEGIGRQVKAMAITATGARLHTLEQLKFRISLGNCQTSGNLRSQRKSISGRGPSSMERIRIDTASGQRIQAGCPS